MAEKKEIEKYFKNLSNRERAIFEGAISMGALFHQFIGVPISKKNLELIKDAIESSIKLQPAIKDVKVKINEKKVEEMESKFNYTTLTEEMLDVKIISRVKDVEAVIRMKYIDKLKYPLIYVEKVRGVNNKI